MARQNLALAPSWAESRNQVTIPGHIRTVSVELSPWGECDVTWDDVSFAAELPQPYDPDAVLTKKLATDEHTVAFVDFDSPGAYRLEGGSRLTDESGGRFGKGLRLERRSPRRPSSRSRWNGCRTKGRWNSGSPRTLSPITSIASRCCWRATWT